jgi:hypothetical protein
MPATLLPVYPDLPATELTLEALLAQDAKPQAAGVRGETVVLVLDRETSQAVSEIRDLLRRIALKLELHL